MAQERTSSTDWTVSDAYGRYEEDPEIADELRQVYQFRNPDINTEVWFVRTRFRAV